MNTLKALIKDLATYPKDMRLIFTKSFVNKNYYKHFGLMFMVSSVTFPLFYYEFHLLQAPTLFILFIGGFLGFAVGFVYEWYMAVFYDCLFDMIDVKMTSYGSLLAFLIGVLFVRIF